MTPVQSTEASKFKRILTRNLVLPLLIGVVSAAAFIGLIAYLLSSVGWVDHTQGVISSANQVAALASDMETGTRGFLLSGDDKFLSPYQLAKPKLKAELDILTARVADNPSQVDRLRRVSALVTRWDEFAQQVITLRREGKPFDAIVRGGLGKDLFDELRREMRAFVDTEERLLFIRNSDARSNAWLGVSLYVLFLLIVSAGLAYAGRRDITGLSNEYATALQQQTRSAEAMGEQAWLRSGQADLAEQLVGQLPLKAIGRNVLSFLASQLGVMVGAIYVRQDDGSYGRIASYGFSPESEQAEQQIGAEDGLVAQSARDGKVIRVEKPSAHYLKVASGLGYDAPTELLLAPFKSDGTVNGVIELGFMHAVGERDLGLLSLIQNTIGAAVESALFRRRLQDAVEETRQLNEELQVQQEELRTANEELSEQSRVLTESQTNLEHQQAELEQTNEQLSAQAEVLDRKNEALHEAQASLQQRADELQRASRYKSEFLANMSHELRTPLNSSLILAKLLGENRAGNLNEEQLQFANTIYAAGNDLLNLINDILDLSKVEAGKLELNPQQIQIRTVAESLRAIFSPLAQDKHLAFDIDIAADAPKSLLTDGQRLEQVLKNLLSNAIKFTEKGRVTMAVRAAADGRIRFEVTDTGIGIAPQEQSLIFEAFHQGDGGTSRKYGGTGLGLSISRELAAMLGGTIELHSEVGQGSRFTLTLPAQLPAQSAPTRPAPAPMAPTAPATFTRPAPAPFTPIAPAPFTPSTVPDDRNENLESARVLLVVEDDPSFGAILYGLAREMQYRCLVAGSVQEALSLITSHSPQAILLDVRLPDGSGLGVLQRLKEDPATRHIPVHIIAAEDFREIALPMGAVGFAIKPTTRDELVGILQKLERRGAQAVKRLLLVEDDDRQRESIVHLIGDDDIEIAAVDRGEAALELLRKETFDCMIIDLKLPDMDGHELLERMAGEARGSFPPVIVYTGRNLTREEEAQLNKYSRSIIIKGARSPERLLDEVTLFLHKVESQLSAERQTMLRTARNREHAFEGRKVLLVDDDMRNVFALSAALEQRGLTVEIGRNGVEAIDKLNQVDDIDLVLMDVMMPVMDGLEATRRIRADARFAKLPIIAITAKAMKDDQEQCRRAGANDYLAKPIDLDRLVSLLRVWIPSVERL